MVVQHSKAEIKSIIQSEMGKEQQKEWDKGNKGRHYYSILRKVGEMRKVYTNKKEEDIMSRIRFGHTGLNSTLKIVGKHASRRCEHCGHQM